MKVLITGGMGVIGAETSRKFVRVGHRPGIFARHPHQPAVVRDQRYARYGRELRTFAGEGWTALDRRL
jgi:hypothetical protein